MGIFKIFNVTTTVARRNIDDAAVVAQGIPNAPTHCLYINSSV
jgi:hypothetical protein